MKNIFRLKTKSSVKPSEDPKNSLNNKYNYTLYSYYRRHSLNDNPLGEGTSFHIPFYGTLEGAKEQAWSELRKSVAFEVSRGASFQEIKDSVELKVKPQFTEEFKNVPYWVPSHRDIVKYLESAKTRREIIREKYDKSSKVIRAAWKKLLPQKGM